jgi:hypothetical protein
VPRHRESKIARFPFPFCGDHLRSGRQPIKEARKGMGILWIILIVVLVLALLGFFSRGRW